MFQIPHSILGASQATRISWLTYHLLVLKVKDGHYEDGFTMNVKDADLNNRVPGETWAKWMEGSNEVLGLERVPWLLASSDREEWDKVFLIAKHLGVEKREILVR